MDDKETARVSRALKKAILKRDECVRTIRTVHALAERCATDRKLVSQLSICIDDLNEIWTSYTTENNTVIDCLIDLDRESEYSVEVVGELRELITFSRAVLAQYSTDTTVKLSFSRKSSISATGHESIADSNPNPMSNDQNDHTFIDDENEAEAPVDTNSSRSRGMPKQMVARLPEVPLPVFHGDIFKWLAFRDRFVSMVDMRTSISNIDKFYYLIGCLRENALDAISGIPISGDNYELAWSTLKARFDRPRLVAHLLINRLLSAPKASTESLIELNNFLVIFDEGVSVLESLRVPNLGDFLLFSVASRCLPAQSIKLFETQLGDGFPTMRELLTFIKSRINVLECVPRDSISKNTKPIPQKRLPFAPVGFNNPKRQQHSSFITNTATPKSTDTCKICKGSHNVSACRKFGSWLAAARHKWVRDNKLCFRCLRGGHWAPDCKSIVPCDKCMRRHHPLLHPDDGECSEIQDNPTVNTQRRHSEHEAQTSLVGHGGYDAHSVILGTALVHMRDCGGTLQTVRALIDSASQISAITAACSSRLGLSVTRWTAPVSGLSGTSVQNVQGLVKCHVQPKFAVEPVLKFEAWVFPTITANMPGQLIAKNIQEKYSNLALADPSFAIPDSVDLLLGADLFARVMNGKRISVGESYPVAFGSVFGWIIIGPIPHVIDHIHSSCPISLTTSVEQLMDRFWQVEGPDILSSPVDNWHTNVPNIPVDQLPEIKTTPITLVTDIQISSDVEWYTRFSSYSRMTRVVARMYRFINGCRRKAVNCHALSRHELDTAVMVLIKCSQRFSFRSVFHDLSHNVPITTKPIARLRPFVNDDGVLCVGGRLSRAQVPIKQKHPVLLAKTSHLSLLLIRHWHIKTGHGGPRILSSIINREYWILSINTLIRTVISKCTTCVRLSATNPQPVMADLPASRVIECHPFSRVGIDFCGPLQMKEKQLRKSRQYKVYVAVFVCFVVKAVHLEYVSDLSTDAFVAALQRFVARRGLPTDIYTDCGTNFVGADNLFRTLINDPECQDRLTASVHCIWHFNPPGAPHFGGLWEAAVRSAKRLMVRIMGEHIFTLEEFSTMLCRIEAILNSRPLVASSSDPDEIDCLSPGHFLIGRPLLSVPEKELSDATRTLGNRWKLLNQAAQAFWRRWRDEYLNTLQSRNRWTRDAPNIDVNDVVVIKDPHDPPLKWSLARVEQTLSGADSVVRVVRLRTATGTLIRPVVKIVKLPTDAP